MATASYAEKLGGAVDEERLYGLHLVVAIALSYVALFPPRDCDAVAVRQPLSAGRSK
ncbi:MAG: hypothetical protein ACP5MH_06635 [Thermoproteus sp.]